jgi:DNA polymerase elongation subunit (family B)
VKPMEAIIDIETTGLDYFQDRIIAIGLAYEIKEGIKLKVFINEDEEQLLSEFWQFMEKLDPTKIIGFNFEFDWSFIINRSLKYKIKMKYYRRYYERIDLRKILNTNNYAKGRLIDYSQLFGIEEELKRKFPEKEKLGDKMKEAFENKDFKAIEFHVKLDVLRTLGIWKLIKKYLFNDNYLETRENNEVKA